MGLSLIIIEMVLETVQILTIGILIGHWEENLELYYLYLLSFNTHLIMIRSLDCDKSLVIAGSGSDLPF